MPLVITCLLSSCLLAPPQATYFFPAGASRGQTVAVSAGGSFSNWPVSAWVDRPGLEVTAAEKKGSLEFCAGADAEPGVYWVRLYDDQGASSLRPFIVGTIPELVETEPNNLRAEAQTLPASVVVNGRLGKSGDADTFQVRLAQGQTLVASLTAHEDLNSPMDAVLQICDADGFVLEQNDDYRGLDPMIAFPAPRDGTYLLRLFAFPSAPNSTIGLAGGDTWIYRLTATTGGFIDHGLPTALAAGAATDVSLFGWNLAEPKMVADAPGDGAARRTLFQPDVAGVLQLPVVANGQVTAESAALGGPTRLVPPAVVSGRIGAEHETDAFMLSASKGQKLAIRVESRSLGFPLDAVLRVLDASGKVLSETDDVSQQPDPAIVHTVAEDGELRVTVHDLYRRGGLRYVYRLTIGEQRPDVVLTAGADVFVAAAGKPAEIPVTIERRAGFSEKLVLAIEGLPDGLSAPPVESSMGDKSEKAVKLVVSGEAEWSGGPIRIVGRAGDQVFPVRFPIGGTNAHHETGWLTK